MKIRAGFVSNSSSSSFCIFGAEFTRSEILEKFDPNEEIGCPYEVCEENFKDISWLVIPEDEYIYIGLGPYDIRDDETGAEFKARVKKLLEDAMNQKVKCQWHEGAYYC